MKAAAMEASLARWFDEVPSASADGEMIPVDLIDPDPDQPRKDFDPDSLQALADSMAVVGQLLPIRVVALPTGRHRIVFGERRWRAARLAGFSEIRAQVVTDPAINDGGAGEGGGAGACTDEWLAQVAENLARKDLRPLEVLAIVRQVTDSEGRIAPAVRDALGMPDRTLRRYLSILRSPEAISALEGGTPVKEAERIALRAAPRRLKVRKAPKSGHEVRHVEDAEMGGARGRAPGGDEGELGEVISLVTELWSAGDDARAAVLGAIEPLRTAFLGVMMTAGDGAHPGAAV